MKGKVNQHKERHNIWFEPRVWSRIEYLANKIKRKMNFQGEISEIVNEACRTYRRTHEEDFVEMKRIAAIKLTAAQEEMKLIEQAEAAYILKKKNELKEELGNAFGHTEK